VGGLVRAATLIISAPALTGDIPPPSTMQPLFKLGDMGLPPFISWHCLPVKSLLGLGLTVRYSAVGVGVNSALQCGWG